MAHSLPGPPSGYRFLRWWLHPAQLRDLILEPHLDLVTHRLERVPVHLGGGRSRTAHEEDSEEGAAGEIQLLFHAKALESVKDAVTTVLEVLGEGSADGGEHERLRGRGHDG
jgi:hypothetical protein